MTLLDARPTGAAPLDVEGAPATTAGKAPRRRRVTRMRGLVGGAAPVLLCAAVVLAVWQGAVWARVRPDYQLPSPAQVLDALREQAAQGALWPAVGTSLVRGLTGFALAVAVATPLGLLVGRVRPLRLAVRPLLSGMQTLPSVAWVAPAVLWFGLSRATVYAVVLLGTVPSVANALVGALDAVPPVLLRAGRVLGARGPGLARHVLLPAALPGYVAGLRQGWAFAWHALMTAEVIAVSPQIGRGLGQLLDQGRELSDIALVLGAVVAILLVGVAVDRLLFTPLERRVLARRGLA